MVELISRSGCVMSGENEGAFIHLGMFDRAVRRTDNRPRGTAHGETAWRKVYDLGDVRKATAAVVAAMLNPRRKNCFGFKEIRYGRGSKNAQSFENDIAYLRTLCDNPKIVLHMRRSPEPELASHVLRKLNTSKGTLTEHMAQRELFVRVARNDSSGPFLHYLEDYIEGNFRHKGFWRYLGLNEPNDTSLVSVTSAP